MISRTRTASPFFTASPTFFSILNTFPAAPASILMLPAPAEAAGAAAAAGAAGCRHDRVPAVEPVPDGERCRRGMLRRTGGPGGPGAGGRAGGRHPVPGPPVDPRYLLPVCLSHPPGSADSLPPSVRAAQAQGLICIIQAALLCTQGSFSLSHATLSWMFPAVTSTHPLQWTFSRAFPVPR